MLKHQDDHYIVCIESEKQKKNKRSIDEVTTAHWGTTTQMIKTDPHDGHQKTTTYAPGSPFNPSAKSEDMVPLISSEHINDAPRQALQEMQFSPRLNI